MKLEVSNQAKHTEEKPRQSESQTQSTTKSTEVIMNHTPEPWKASFHKTAIGTPFGIITGGKGKGGLMDTVICHGPDFRAESISFRAFESGNARRIVACVNACNGSSTEWLEFQYNDERLDQLGEPEPFETRYTNELRKALQIMEHRDQLLEAMHLIASISEGSTTANSLQHIAKLARAAIAKATGEAS